MAMPASSVTIPTTPAKHMPTQIMKKRFRAPARSAIPPRSGEVNATINAESDTARPHHQSPSPAWPPTTWSR